MMHPASKVNMRDDVASGGNMLENPEARRREMQGFQISNVQIRPPRVGSAPVPHNAPMNFQPMLGSRNASHMLGSTQGINDPGNQGFFPNSMFPQRTIPRTQSPIGMPSGGYFTGGDVRQDGGFPPRPMMFHNSQQQEKFDTHDQQGQIDEIESNSVSSDEKPTKVPIHANGNRGNKLMYNTNIMGISEMINEDEFVTEKNSRENYSGAGSGNHDTQRKKPAQPSNRMRGQLNQQSVKPSQQAPGSNLPSYQVYESYQNSAAYRVDNQSKPYSEHVDNPSDGYYKQIYDKVNDQYYEQNYYEYDTYGQSDYDDQPYQNHRDANVPSYDQSYGKQQAKNKGKDKKGKPRNGKDRENIETYEPSGGRNTPGGHAKNKNYNGEKYPIHNVTQDWNKQQGSRYIQHLLGSQDKDMANSIVREMIPQMVDISLNIFGNYVAQKMIEVANPTTLKLIMNEVAKHIEIFCFNSFGCRVVLKLYDIMAITDEDLIQNYADSYIERNVRKMMLDQNANYIIQKIIMLQPSNKIHFITDIFVRETFKLCDNPFACRVLQRLVLKARPEKRDAIYSQLRNKIYMLSFCQFGNYLVQHMAEKGNDADKSAIADMIISNIMEMSFDKFASNVVECALKHWTLDFLERLFDELCHSSKQNPSITNLVIVIQNSYGNYVAQSLFKNSDESIKRAYYRLLNDTDRKTIMSNHYSKHVYSNVSSHFNNAKKEVNSSLD